MPTKRNIKVFVDTNIFVALKDSADPTHKQAVKLSEKFYENKAVLYTSSDVIGETLTVISKKLGKTAARSFAQDYAKSGINELFIDEFLHKSARKLFARTKSKNISFIDCSSVVTMKKYSIPLAFTFDRDFKKLGVKIV